MHSFLHKAIFYLICNLHSIHMLANNSLYLPFNLLTGFMTLWPCECVCVCAYYEYTCMCLSQGLHMWVNFKKQLQSTVKSKLTTNISLVAEPSISAFLPWSAHPSSPSSHVLLHVPDLNFYSLIFSPLNLLFVGLIKALF